MRTKVEVIEEHSATRNIDDMWAISSADFDPEITPRPPLNNWIKIKLPYEATEHPVLPSLEEIDKGMRENRLTQSGGLFAVCKVGKCVVKMGADRIILQVTKRVNRLINSNANKNRKLKIFYTCKKIPKSGCQRYTPLLSAPMNHLMSAI